MTEGRTIPNILGAWNSAFTYVPTMLGRPVVDPADQVAMLRGLGYRGLAILDTHRLPEFAALPQIRSGEFRIIAACVPFNFYEAPDMAAIEATAQALKALGGDMWLVMTNPLMPAAVRHRITEVADIAAANDVRLILYPHFATALMTAEDGVRWIEALGRDEIKVALNISHELKFGNGGRLGEVIRAVAPHLGAVTINGADRDVAGEDIQGSGTGYDRSIQALGAGDFDVYHEYLLPLLDAGYAGPIVMHDLVVADPAEHFASSMNVWKRWAAGLAR